MNTAEHDIVVVGAGLGGLSAALRAAEAGRSVLLIEAAPAIGGTAYFSGGGVHIWGAETWEAYRRHSPLADPLLARALFEGFGRYVAWLEATGAPGRYERTVIRGLGLLKYQLGRTMAPHARRRWFDHLAARFADHGGTILTDTRGESLIRSNGRVAGVRTTDGTEHGARAVILAAGGFQSDPAQLARHIGNAVEAFVQRAVATDVGDGLRMALAAGAAQTPAMDSIYGHLMPSPARIDWRDPLAPIMLSAFYARQGIVVNRAGRRFVDEHTGELDGTTINAAAHQPPGLWVILDEAIRRGPARYQVPAELIRPSSLRHGRLLRHARIGWSAGRPALFLDSLAQAQAAGARIVRAGSIDALASRIDADGLAEEVVSYNAAVISGRGAALPVARTGPPLPLLRAPFAAVRVGVGVSMTYGGVRIDAKARALDAGGSPVAGLYAVPGTAGGVHHLHYAGALAACGVFGMIAADSASAAFAANP